MLAGGADGACSSWCTADVSRHVCSRPHTGNPAAALPYNKHGTHQPYTSAAASAAAALGCLSPVFPFYVPIIFLTAAAEALRQMRRGAVLQLFLLPSRCRTTCPHLQPAGRGGKGEPTAHPHPAHQCSILCSTNRLGPMFRLYATALCAQNTRDPARQCSI